MSEPRTSGLRLIPALLTGLILRRTGLGVAKVRAKVRAKTEAPAEAEWDYERSDIAAGRTAWVMLGLAGAVLVTLAAVLGLSHIVLTSQRTALPPLTPQQTRAIRPPPPNLQPDPYADITAKERDEAARLAGYAYLDPERTRARIPLDRAMALMAGRPFDPEPGEAPAP